jgi:toxin ParE1/3/4
MLYSITISTDALHDLNDIMIYISHDKPQTATTFASQLIAKIRTLSASPKRCPIAIESKVLNYEMRHLIHFPYRILYRIKANTVIILRIIHGARTFNA